MGAKRRTQEPAPIIGSERRYVGRAHPWAAGLRVKIVSVLRGPGENPELLREDRDIGALRADDVVEFVPLVEEEGQAPRWSWVSSDARPDELAAL